MFKIKKLLVELSLSIVRTIKCFSIYAETWLHNSDGWSYQSDSDKNLKGTYLMSL